MFLHTGVREAGEDGGHGAAPEGGHQDQPVPLHPGERHLGSGRRQEHPRPLQELKAHPPASGLPGGQLQNHDGKART